MIRFECTVDNEPRTCRVDGKCIKVGPALESVKMAATLVCPADPAGEA